MKSIKFKGFNHTYAENQRESDPLYVLEDAGAIVTCWKLTWREAFKVLWTRRIWHAQMTLGAPPQPIYKTTNKNEIILK